jgi:hypothetical protein
MSKGVRISHMDFAVRVVGLDIHLGGQSLACGSLGRVDDNVCEVEKELRTHQETATQPERLCAMTSAAMSEHPVAVTSTQEDTKTHPSLEWCYVDANQQFSHRTGDLAQQQ